jgi:tricarballylate dehydrogenase
MTMTSDPVVVVGAGNAALSAALSAREAGASVIVLERAPEDARGGNSAFTGGAFRVAYDGADDIASIADVSDHELATSDFGSYPEAQFLQDLAEMSGYRADPELLYRLVADSKDSLLWLRRQGVRFLPSYGRQSFRVDGRAVFWGGLTIEAAGGGLGLMESLFARAAQSGIRILYRHNVARLLLDRNGVCGVAVRTPDGEQEIAAGAVILAAGGFHANAEWRTRYLGPGWESAKVRGSRFNTGGGIRAALDAGALAHGNWSGCHSVFFDARADAFGTVGVLNQQKNYFTLGIVVNSRGERFFDEGSDFRNYTYSRMGSQILRQPGGYGWQIFDADGVALLPDEYRTPRAARFQADTLDALIAQLEGVDQAALKQTIARYNAACDPATPFNPAIKDGKSTRGLDIDKSNWANPIAKPPFTAFHVTCGITCTFAGIAIDEEARVLGEDGLPIPGLHACGEMVGGLYYDRYPGGAGLMSGTVFGRIAGTSAVRLIA